MTVTSRPAVHSGIAQFFGGATYDQEARAYRGSGPLQQYGLSTVRAYLSKRVNDRDYVLGQAAGRGMGAYMVVEMPEDTERREAIAGGPGPLGIKIIRYRVILHVFHLAHEPHSEDAEADVDNLTEEIKSLIRSDRTLGGTVAQAGETSFGIHSNVRAPMLTDEVTGTYISISFDADVHIVS